MVYEFDFDFLGTNIKGSVLGISNEIDHLVAFSLKRLDNFFRFLNIAHGGRFYFIGLWIVHPGLDVFFHRPTLFIAFFDVLKGLLVILENLIFDIVQIAIIVFFVGLKLD